MTGYLNQPKGIFK